jgi:hypothetical protein
MKLTDEKKRVKKLHKSYNDARKRITEAILGLNPGTGVYLSYAKALQDLDSKERAEEIALGLTPANLGAMVTTEFHYVAHVSVMPATREEAEAIVRSQIKKDIPKLAISDADEAMRKQLGEEYR